MFLQTRNNLSTPNFGIKYIEPRNWPPDVLDTLMKSDFVKRIDSKYPNAEVSYSSYFNKFSKKFVTKLSFKFDKTMEETFLTRSNIHMIDEIKKASLEKIEQRYKNKIKIKKEKEEYAVNVYKAAEESNRNLTNIKRENIFNWFMNLFK